MPASTLHHCKEKGLIASNGRHGLRRPFDADVLERLTLIGLGRAVGLSSNGITGVSVTNGALRIDRAALAAETDELDRTIRRLVTVHDGLRHAAACPARKHMGRPTLRRLLRATAAGTIKPRRKASGA